MNVDNVWNFIYLFRDNFLHLGTFIFLFSVLLELKKSQFMSHQSPKNRKVFNFKCVPVLFDLYNSREHETLHIKKTLADWGKMSISLTQPNKKIAQRILMFLGEAKMWTHGMHLFCDHFWLLKLPIFPHFNIAIAQCFFHCIIWIDRLIIIIKKKAKALLTTDTVPANDH